MELIKRIKETESQGREIIEQARADSIKSAQDSKEEYTAMLNQAQEDRKAAITKAESDAEVQGQSQVDALKAKGSDEREKLAGYAKGKAAECVGEVVSHLRGL